MFNSPIRVEEEFGDSILRYGYGKIPQYIIRDETLSQQAKLIYAYLSSYVWKGRNDAYPSAARICKELVMSKNTFYKHSGELKKRGLIASAQQKDPETHKFLYTVYSLNYSEAVIKRIKLEYELSQEEKDKLLEKEYKEQLKSIPLEILKAYIDAEKKPCTAQSDTEPCTTQRDTGPYTTQRDTGPCTSVRYTAERDTNKISNNNNINLDITEKENTCVPATPDTPPAEGTGPKEPKKYDFEDFEPEAVGLAVRLAIGVRQNHPKTPKKQCPDPELSPDNELLWKWTHQIELLHKVGITGADKAEGLGWSWEEIEAIIDYAMNDRRFWSRNARSAFTIREKADKIHDAMRDDAVQREKRKGKTATPAPVAPKPEPPKEPTPFDDEGIYLVKPGETRYTAMLRVDEMVSRGEADEKKMIEFRKRIGGNVG